MFGRRPDATLARDVPALRRFMPFISPRRPESMFWFSYDVDAEESFAYLAELNAARPEKRPITFFHLVLHALVRVLHERPRMNRFVAGGRLWQRDGIWLSFSAKVAFDDDAPVITVKQRFDPNASVVELADQIYDKLSAGRSGKKTTSDHEVDWMLRLPVPLIRLAMGAAHLADRFGLLPRAMIDSDPLYASVFVANLGSVGLEGGYHHLWEHGNIGAFLVIGRFERGADGRRRVTIKITFDERIEDGLYAARSLGAVKEWLEHPEKS
ncbi:MAG: hypothetical protein DCC71_01785 [Proteobacteria bacterium]|nr:MAG: hypothetical protein DCC71_01785 [Pseudomonadota bacterium]